MGKGDALQPPNSPARGGQESVASLERLLQFYAKDPAGAKGTREELDKERQLVASLEARVAELQASLRGDLSTEDSSGVAADTESGAADEEEEEEDLYDDDEFNVDALSACLRNVAAADHGAPTTLTAATEADTASFNVDALSEALRRGAGSGGGDSAPLEGLAATLAGLGMTNDLDLGEEEEEEGFAPPDAEEEAAGAEQEEEEGIAAADDGAVDDARLTGLMGALKGLGAALNEDPAPFLAGTMLCAFTSDDGVALHANDRVWLGEQSQDGQWVLVTINDASTWVPASHVQSD